MTLVRDVMTPNVVTAHPDTPLAVLVDDMLRCDISGLPVVDDDRHVLGVVTEADLVARRGHTPERRRLLTIVEQALHGQQNRWRQKAAGMLARDLMTAPPLTVGPDADLREAAAVMVTMAVKRLPVVDAEGRLVGIVAQRDVLRLLPRMTSASGCSAVSPWDVP